MKLNVSQSTISAYEMGARTPDLETLIQLALLFEVSLDYLTGISDCKLPQQSDLSLGEQAHLRQYRQLTTVQQEKADAYLDGLLQK